MESAETVHITNRHYPKRVLFYDKSADGEVGGSHQCLLHIVRNLPEEFQKVVVLNSDNALRNEFENSCKKVIVWNGPSATYFSGLPDRRGWNSKCKFRPHWLSRILNKAYKNVNIILNDLGLGAVVFARYLYLLRRERIDILHLNNWSDPYWIIAAKLCRIPVIVHVRGIASSRRDPIWRLVDKAICISNHVRAALIRKGVDQGKIVRIYDAIDLSKFRRVKSREQVRSELGIGNDRRVVSIFGNIQRWKGQETVIKACERLRVKYPDIVCCIFGGIIERDYADELTEFVRAREMERNVRFVGYRNDVPDCMNASDAIVHASIRPEPFGMVVVEGMAVGKPVIAANSGGPVEIVENGVSGLLFEPGDFSQLADRIESVLSCPEEASRLGKSAVRRVEENFRIEKQVELITSIYESLR